LYQQQYQHPSAEKCLFLPCPAQTEHKKKRRKSLKHNGFRGFPIARAVFLSSLLSITTIPLVSLLL